MIIKKYFIISLLISAICFAMPLCVLAHQMPPKTTKDWLADESTLHITGGVDPLTPKQKEFNIATRQQRPLDQLQSKYGLADMWLNFKLDLE